MTTDTQQLEDRASTPAFLEGAGVVAAVMIAAQLLTLAEGAIPPSAWYDPLLWSVSAAVAVAAQATLWTRNRRGLVPVGALLLVGAIYARNTYGTNQFSFLTETPLVWVTGVVCLVTGLVLHLRRSS